MNNVLFPNLSPKLEQSPKQKKTKNKTNSNKTENVTTAEYNNNTKIHTELTYNEEICIESKEKETCNEPKENEIYIESEKNYDKPEEKKEEKFNMKSDIERERLKRELEETIKSVTNYFTITHPFWGTVIANLEIIVDDQRENIAETDCHSKIIFGKGSFGLSKESIKFIYLHEILHVAFSHSQRKKTTYDPIIWNIACDYAVNSILIDEMNYSPPEEISPYYDKKYSKMSAEEIYYDLIGKRIELPLSTLIDLLPSSNPKCEIEKIKTVLIQADIVNSKFGKTRGHIPGMLGKYIKSIKEPKVPFERLLARYVSHYTTGKEEFSYNPIHKRKFIDYEIISPTISKAIEPKVYLVIDTSGSISENDLTIFAGAIKKLSTITNELTVITHDVAVQQVIKPSQIDKFLREIKFKGRGGTSHIKAFEYINDIAKREGNPDVVICLTDGYTEFPSQPKYPVIWALTKTHNPPPWGIKIVIEETD